MLTTIKIADVASYNSAGANLDDLKLVNFVYGNNGSGKSTIAKYLYNLSLEPTSNNFSNCSIQGYNPSGDQILVYDDKFVERNFNKNSTQPGIFSLNEINEDIDTKIETEEKILNKYQNFSNSVLPKFKKEIETEKSTKYRELIDDCFQVRKNILAPLVKNSKLFPFKQAHNNFDQIIKIIANNSTLTIMSKDDLILRYNNLYEKDIVDVKTIVEGIHYTELIKTESQIDKLLGETIVGKSDIDLSGLIEKMGNKKWVEDGLSFIDHNKEVQRCPFCQNETINKNLINKFEDFFDETYREKVNELKQLKDQYKILSQNILGHLTLISKEFNPDNITTDLIHSFREIFENNTAIFAEKEKYSERKLFLNSIKGKRDPLAKLKKMIESNNDDFVHLDSNRLQLSNNIWLYIASKCNEDINNYNIIKKRYTRKLDKIEYTNSQINKKITLLYKNIEGLKDQTVNTSDAVKNINTILKNCGFQSFEIEEIMDKKNNISKYFIKRDGITQTDVFQTLSEGEKNFIAFLYFYELCIGNDNQDNKLKKKIIVIDDPVSSMDSQVLFIVSTLIRKLIERNDNKAGKKLFKNNNIRQAFILTHNLYFYKEVSFERRVICTFIQHYHIIKIGKHSSIEKKDPNKIKFNDYDVLWYEIYNNIQNNNISLLNNMRRVLESYLNFVGKKGVSVWESLGSIDESDPKFYLYTSLLSQVNDGSHKLSINDEMFYSKVSEENREIIISVFENLFCDIGKDHFEAKKLQFSNSYLGESK